MRSTFHVADLSNVQALCKDWMETTRHKFNELGRSLSWGTESCTPNVGPRCKFRWRLVCEYADNTRVRANWTCNAIQAATT